MVGIPKGDNGIVRHLLKNRVNWKGFFWAQWRGLAETVRLEHPTKNEDEEGRE